MQYNLTIKLVCTLGVTLLLALSAWAWFSIQYQQKMVMNSLIMGTDSLANIIRIATDRAMINNARDDIDQILTHIAKEEGFEHIRIYNKDGQIKFSNKKSEINQKTNIKSEACHVCHRSEPPLVEMDLHERARIFDSSKGYRLLGIIKPIYSRPECSSQPCHVHPGGEKVLGALDAVVHLKEADSGAWAFKKRIIIYAVLTLLISMMIFSFFLLRFIKRPVKRMIDSTRKIAMGEYGAAVDVNQSDELGQLAAAISEMGEKIQEKRNRVYQQRDEYRNLLEIVPCIITAQDKNFKLLWYNKEFAEKFNPMPDDYCYHAYKGRTKKCTICPVEKTFEDGLTHMSEETGVNKDGTPTRWIVKTAPIKNEEGDVIAAMEMNIDITQRKALEEELKKSEKKYYAIFNNIPNPVFVLEVDSLEILDCNDSINTIYGYTKDEIINKSFLMLFSDDEKEQYTSLIRTTPFINQARHVTKMGETLYVNIRVSPSEYPGEKVLLVTTSDITKQLETEQQLIQAGKMATLGEMATGVAHELNQPLSVIKTASSFFMKKIKKKEKIEDDILFTMSSEIDSYVDRATKIINHMREFGRKSDMALEKVQVNEVLEKALEILGQQLKIREIDVVWDLEEDLPEIMVDPGRLEQVFVNIIINARDAVDERWQSQEYERGSKKILLKTRSEAMMITITISDTGTGIPKNHLGKIFEPFFTTKKVGQGTGLGLSISYGIIKDCQGSIKAVSNEEEGTSFIIQFPIMDVS